MMLTCALLALTEAEHRTAQRGKMYPMYQRVSRCIVCREKSTVITIAMCSAPEYVRIIRLPGWQHAALLLAQSSLAMEMTAGVTGSSGWMVSSRTAWRIGLYHLECWAFRGGHARRVEDVGDHTFCNPRWMQRRRGRRRL